MEVHQPPVTTDSQSTAGHYHYAKYLPQDAIFLSTDNHLYNNLTPTANSICFAYYFPVILSRLSKQTIPKYLQPNEKMFYLRNSVVKYFLVRTCTRELQALFKKIN